MKTKSFKHTCITRPTKLALLAALAACSVSLPACDAEDEAWDDPGLEQSLDEPSEALGEIEGDILPQPTAVDVEEIAQIQRDDRTYHFIDTGAGIGVGEIAPVDADGILDRFHDAGATALEMYVALGGNGIEAPIALLEDHARQLDIRAPLATDEPLREDVTADEVRDLTAIVSASEGTELGITTGPQANYISDHYDATCTFAADGQTYFDGLWQSYGWNYHWYQYRVGDFGDSPYTGTTGYTSQFRGHSCNNDPVGSPTRTYKTIVYRWHCPTLSDHTALWITWVDEGYRAVYYQTSAGAEVCTHRLRLVDSVHDVQYSLGIMAP